MSNVMAGQWRGREAVALARRALMLVAAFLLASCSSLAPKLETPTMSVLGVQMLSGDMFSQRFRIHVKIENPNDVEVPVRSIDYKLFLMDDRFGEGSSDGGFVLPARGEAEFDMLLTTNFVSALGRLVSRMGGSKLENVEYEITGTLHLEKGWLRSIPFDHKGLVNFSKPPKE
jgi:LEA14-like dessication related protein